MEDKRKARGRIYPLLPLLAIALLAKLCGQNQISELAHWAKLRCEELCQLFGLTRCQMLHLTTWGRILGEGIDPLELQKVLNEFFSQHLGSTILPRGRRVIAIDGKALRGSRAAGQKRGDYMMAAYLAQEGIVIGQVEVANSEKKENEISAAPKLVAQIERHLAGAVVVGDAMQCQRQLSQAIKDKGGDWLWFVKENQPSVYELIQILFEEEAIAAGHSAYPTDFKQWRSVNKGHGRLEERIITVSSMLDADYLKWPEVQQVFKLESRVQRKVGGPESYQVRYGITSLPRQVASPKHLLQLARSEWSIENNLHHRRDNSLREDWSRVGRGQRQQVNSILNNVVVGLSNLAGQANMQAWRRELSYQPGKAVELLTKRFLSRL